MGGVSSSNLKICGSHAGCAIGEDGTSQMGLEDIAMMRAIPDSVVLYPSDKYSMEMAVYLASRHKGLTYIRSTRGAYPHLHSPSTLFSIGKSILLKTHSNDSALIIAAGVTI
jgi:transketolase